MFKDSLKAVIESARGRKFTLKVGGNELTMEEAAEQQTKIFTELRSEIAEIQEKIESISTISATVSKSLEPRARERVRDILWVDDQPKNNSYLIASLEQMGVRVQIARSTEEGLQYFASEKYDRVISDMGRPEGGRAGIDLLKKIREFDQEVPYYIFAGRWAERNLRDEALAAGANGITSSGTSLINMLNIEANEG